MGKWILYILLGSVIFSSCQSKNQNNSNPENYSGSESCIECHAHFYELWAPSHHGKAMQQITSELIINDSIVSSDFFEIEGKTYQVLKKDSTLQLIENDGELSASFDIIWALGGKNVFYFLISIENGKLQTIPLAYDIRKKTWYNNPESAIRHFPEGMPDEALPWKDRMYTFNAACYSCHVSQLNTNYTLETDSYQTTWSEAGINCETCHGPAGEHVRIFKDLKEGEVPESMGLIVTKTFTPEQHNASCAPCHAKMQPITASYTPGDPYFDNFGLTTLENTDFYPDGRDLGENYTMTGWAMNKCAQKSDLHCVTCHTSSGRNRFTGENANNACLPCHVDNVENVGSHSGHYAGTEGAKCVSCHMPKTEFGRMVRSDHSFRPPMPEATIKFDSPNACNICHTDKSAEWANSIVKKRVNSDYQNKTLYWAQLLKEARENTWDNIDKMCQLIDENKNGEVVTTSFIRLLINCPNEIKWKTIIGAMNNTSPLVRSAAAEGLTGYLNLSAKNALVKACSDEYRLVRISAAMALAGYPEEQFAASQKEVVNSATEEYKLSMVSRPDNWSSHYNLGIFYQNRGDIPAALEAYKTSAKLYDQALQPLINSSVLYSYIGDQAKAGESLETALKIDPENEAVNLNYGLLLAEQGKMEEAKNAFKMALETNPNQAVAAYNLSVISSQNSLKEAIDYSNMAYGAAPENPKYGYTLAFYHKEVKNTKQAKNILNEVLELHPGHLGSVYLLSGLFIEEGKIESARKVYEKALKAEILSDAEKLDLQQALNQLGI